MSSTAITTVIKMMESLPVEHFREYISDLQDEARWEQSFQKTQANLVAAARRAREEMRKGVGV